MKKFLFTLGIIMMGYGRLFAQLTADAIDGINSIGNALNVKAGENVTIQEGFNVEEGAELDISIEEIPDCSNNY